MQSLANMEASEPRSGFHMRESREGEKEGGGDPGGKMEGHI